MDRRRIVKWGDRRRNKSFCVHVRQVEARLRSIFFNLLWHCCGQNGVSGRATESVCVQ
jgi:hypothetical protein